MGGSTSLMTAVAFTATLVLSPVFWSQEKLKCNGTESVEWFVGMNILSIFC